MTSHLLKEKNEGRGDMLLGPWRSHRQAMNWGIHPLVKHKELHIANHLNGLGRGPGARTSSADTLNTACETLSRRPSQAMPGLLSHGKCVTANLWQFATQQRKLNQRRGNQPRKEQEEGFPRAKTICRKRKRPSVL